MASKDLMRAPLLLAVLGGCPSPSTDSTDGPNNTEATDSTDNTDSTDTTDDTDPPMTWPASGVVLPGVMVVDVAGVRGPAWVVIEDETIFAVHLEDPGLIPDHLDALATTGQFITPGLIEPHAHLFLSGATVDVGDTLQDNLRAQLLFGVTSVVDAGGPQSGVGLLRFSERADWQGPSVKVLSPFITAAGAHPCEVWNQPSRCWYADESGSGAPLGTQAMDLGFSGVKISVSDAAHTPWPTPRPNLEELKGAVDRATARGGLTYAHVNTETDALDALDAGAAHLSHPVFGSTTTEAGRRRLRDEATAIHTTFSAFNGVDRVVNDRVPWTELDGATPTRVLDNWMFVRDNPDVLIKGWLRENAGWHTQAQTSTRMLHAEGATVLPASDAGYLFVPHGLGLHWEMQALQAQGRTATESLAAATDGAATALGWTDRGRIEVGLRADLLVVGSDPLADLSTLSQPNWTIVAGTPWTRAQLLSEWQPLATSPAAANGRFCIQGSDCNSGRCDGWTKTCQPSCLTAWSVDNGCGADAVCTPTADGPTCRPVRTCDLITASGCEPAHYAENCIPSDRDSNVCWPAGPRTQWETCGGLDPETFCAAGHTCSPIDGLCYRLCDVGDPSVCDSGTTCKMQQVSGRDGYALCLP